METKDRGPQPYVADIEKLTLENNTFRTAVWTGKNLQLTVMSVPVGGDVGLEVHPDNDQFFRIEQGQARFETGPSEDNLTLTEDVSEDQIMLVQAGTWHNITNTGTTDLKLYTLYGPAHHPHGTVHTTQADDID